MALTGILGNVGEFDPQKEEWPRYVERLEQFFEANGITGEANATKRRSTFLTVVGPAPYTLLSCILAPVKPTEKTFEEFVAVPTTLCLLN